MRVVVLVFVSLSFLVGCSSSKNAKVKLAEEDFISQVVHDKLNDEPVEKIYNKKYDFVIVISKIERGFGFPAATTFAIIDLAKKRVVYVESVHDGKVSWIDNDRVLIKRVPEVRSKIEEENKKAMKTELNIREL